MTTNQQPQTADEQAQVDYGDHLIWQLVGAKIVTFGANAAGEIMLSTEKEGKKLDLIIGKDEIGEISVFEVEIKAVTA